MCENNNAYEGTNTELIFTGCLKKQNQQDKKNKQFIHDCHKYCLNNKSKCDGINIIGKDGKIDSCELFKDCGLKDCK